jgi:hypothetical protein
VERLHGWHCPFWQWLEQHMPLLKQPKVPVARQPQLPLLHCCEQHWFALKHCVPSAWQGVWHWPLLHFPEQH